MILVAIPLAAISTAVILFVAFLFGHVADLRCERGFKPFQRLPVIKGQRVLPIYIILPMVLGYLVWKGFYLPLGILIGTVLAVILVEIILVGATALHSMLCQHAQQKKGDTKTKEPGFWYLTREYVRAKKQKLCPIIAFVD